MADKLEELRQQWRHLSPRVDDLEEANRRLSERLANNKVTTLQERLSSRIKITMIIGLCLPLICPAMYVLLDLPMWYCALYGLFGLLMAWLQYGLLNCVRAQRLADMPVAEAAERAAQIRLKTIKLKVIGLSAAIVVIALGATVLPIEFVEAALIGLAVGAVIGISRLRKSMRMVNQIVEFIGEKK